MQGVQELQALRALQPHAFAERQPAQAPLWLLLVPDLMSDQTLYLVITKGWRYRSVSVARVTKKIPTLRPSEVAVKLELHIPYEVLEPKTTTLVITKDHIIHPPVVAKQT